MSNSFICLVVFMVSVASTTAFNLSPTNSTPPSAYTTRFSNGTGKTNTELEEVNPGWVAGNECGGDENGNVWCPFGTTKSPILLGTGQPETETEGSIDDDSDLEEGQGDEIESETSPSNDNDDTEAGDNESATTTMMTDA